MDTRKLDARLGEYLQQLALLEQEDIRIPNQSLILDFFCIEEDLTELLRSEVFCDTAPRHKVWSHINLRDADSRNRLAVEDLSLLLGIEHLQSSGIWDRIAISTAERQNNTESLRIINDILRIDTSEGVVLFGEQVVLSDIPGNQAASEEDETSIDCPIISRQLQPVSSKEENDTIYNRNERLLNNQSANVKSNAAGVIIGSGFGLAFLLIGLGTIGDLISESYNDSTTEPKEYTPSTSPDDTAELTRLENDSKNAVLICELRPIIERADSLSLSEQSSIARKNKLVSEMKNSIAFLDQKSGKGYSYWEDPGCRWGFQWFDENTDAAWRAFVAVSNKCKHPVLHYGMVKSKNGDDYIGKRQISLTNHSKGEVRLPYFPGDGYGSIKDITCQR